jgi:phasin family protein
MTNLFFDTWKRQLDVGLNVMEAVVEGAVRMRECQLEAAAQAHADLEATRQAIAAAPDFPALLKLQGDWARANAERAAAYWRSLYQCVADTDAAVMKCSCAGAPASLAAAPSPDALLGAMDGAYRQWLQTVQRLYQPVEKATA